MTTNTLGEFSDGEDDFVFEIDENVWNTNTLGEFSDGEDDFVFEIDENVWNNNSEDDDDLIRSIDEDQVLNQAGRFEMDENLWNNSEDDDNVIRNIDEDEVLNQTGRFETDENLWNNSEDGDNVIRSIDEDELLNQSGRGEKRKSDEQLLPVESGEDYYSIETKKKHHSKKFRMTATDHTIRFNNVLHDVDLLESHERTQAIFHHLLADVTSDMNPNDQVRFVLRSDQLQTPISIPFLPLEELTTEKVFSQIERVIQSNEDFRLNDTVTVDIIHVETPQGSGKSKRTTLNIREYLKKKGSVISINNTDNLCLARALSVGIARIEKDPKYRHIKDSKGHIQLQRALDLHQAANVPLGPCGMDEVKLFQQHLTNYQIIVVSGDHNNCIIYPPQPPANSIEEKSIYLYFHANHFDIITSIPGFLNRSYFCHRCHKPYDCTTDHICPAMCRSCRGFGCVYEAGGIV